MSKFDDLLIAQDEFNVCVGKALDELPSDALKLDLLFVRFKEDNPVLSNFVKVLMKQLVNYIIPARKRDEVKRATLDSNGDIYAKSIELFIEARDTLISYNISAKNQNRYSEIAELIAFCIASEYLGAPQIASKMYLKTNSQMPIHGLDGLHAKVDEFDDLVLYYLESKLSNNFDSCASDFAESVDKFEKNNKFQENEFRIIHDFGNFDALVGDAKNAALDYFNPYSQKSNSIKERYVGALTYSEPQYGVKHPVCDNKPASYHEDLFKMGYKAKHSNYLQKLCTQIEKYNLNKDKLLVFALAIPDSENLKLEFAKAVSGEHILQPTK